MQILEYIRIDMVLDIKETCYSSFCCIFDIFLIEKLRLFWFKGIIWYIPEALLKWCIVNVKFLNRFQVLMSLCFCWIKFVLVILIVLNRVADLFFIENCLTFNLVCHRVGPIIDNRQRKHLKFISTQWTFSYPKYVIRQYSSSFMMLWVDRL